MTKKVGMIESLITVLPLIAQGDAAEHRQDVLTECWDEIEVDTCCAPDTDAWETGVRIALGSWKITEQYEDRAAAVIGHAKWVALLRANPNAELPDEFLWE